MYCNGFAVVTVVLKMGFFLPDFCCFVLILQLLPSPTALNSPYEASRGLVRQNYVDLMSRKSFFFLNKKKNDVVKMKRKHEQARRA